MEKIQFVIKRRDLLVLIDFTENQTVEQIASKLHCNVRTRLSRLGLPSTALISNDGSTHKLLITNLLSATNQNSIKLSDQFENKLNFVVQNVFLLFDCAVSNEKVSTDL